MEKVLKPWGDFLIIDEGKSYKVKRIKVNPGEILSLQSHEKRSEHWTIVNGKARVTIDDQVLEIAENNSVYIPVNSIHRIENCGDKELIFIEVMYGDYTGEDDIIRYKDKYNR